MAILGVIGGWFLNLMQGEKVLISTPEEGEEEITVPKIPGMEVISAETKGDGTVVTYLRKGPNVVEQIKDPIKNSMEMQGWNLKKEEFQDEFWIMELAKEERKLTIKLGFEEGKGIILILEY